MAPLLRKLSTAFPSLLLLLLPHTQASYLYVSSYDGNLTTLSLTPNIGTSLNPHDQYHGHPWPNPGNYGPEEWTYNLDVISTFNTSVQSPSWLTLNKQNNILYLIDEGLTGPNGTLVAYRTNPATGVLSELHRAEALQGGVYGTFFSNGAALAVPHYTGSSLQTYSIDANGGMTLLQTFTFTMAHAGPVPNRQDAPHPHETILDPTGQYILVTDLGADLVRVFAVNPSSSTPTLTATASLQAKAGSGPRHGAFSLDPVSGEYVFYLAGEIAATVTGYRVAYQPNRGGLVFTEVTNGVYPSLGPGHPVPATTTGESTGVTAELTFSPDGKFLIASNRRDLSFNATTRPISYPIPSDSLATWRFKAGATDGELEFLGLFPAGGSYPRQFSLNRAGDLVAVGLQESQRVVVMERDTESGFFVRQVAEVGVEGAITCVVWDD